MNFESPNFRTGDRTHKLRAACNFPIYAFVLSAIYLLRIHPNQQFVKCDRI